MPRAQSALVVVDDKTGSSRPFKMDIYTRSEDVSVRLRRKRNGNPPGAAFCPACSISWAGTRQPAGGEASS
jgi:hypothetical protein